MHQIHPVDPSVRRIAVLRANLLGDFVCSLPAFDALRAAYPAAEIVLLGREWHAAFLRRRPGPIDRVASIPQVWDSDRGLAEGGIAPDLDLVLGDLARARFDLAIQLHGGGRHSNPLVLRLGARRTIGLRTPDAACLDAWVPYIFYQHEITRCLEVVALAGARPVQLEPRIQVTDADLAEACRVAPQSGRPLAALHPGASDTRRRWPVEKFAAVGDALAAAGAQVVVTGTADERPLVKAVVATMRAPALDLTGQLTLSGLAGLLSRCRVTVSNDTGPLHLASAVGSATVGIYWCGNMITFGPLSRTAHRPAIAWQVLCPLCGVSNGNTRCSHDASFVADVPVEEVTASALDLFAART